TLDWSSGVSVTRVGRPGGLVGPRRWARTDTWDDAGGPRAPRVSPRWHSLRRDRVRLDGERVAPLTASSKCVRMATICLDLEVAMRKLVVLASLVLGAACQHDGPSSLSSDGSASASDAVPPGPPDLPIPDSTTSHCDDGVKDDVETDVDC